MIKIPLLGCHVSAAGSPTAAIENATRLGATAIQFFASSPRQWGVRIPRDEDVAEFRHAFKTSAVEKTFLHGPYLVNLGSALPAMQKKSVDALVSHMRIAEAFGSEGVIFHMGSSKGTFREASIKDTIAGMKKVLVATDSAFLIMENSSGGGDKLGSGIEELGEIYAGVNSPRVKMCLDTAHVFESGVIVTYSPEEIAALYKKIDQQIGGENLVALHVNDSKTECGSHTDRHENLGEGLIGLQAFKNLAASKLFSHCSWLLEVPGFDGNGPDEANMEILRRCHST